MADNFRSRDPQARGAASDSLADPLAELARLIGERAPRSAGSGTAVREAERYDEAPANAGLDWVAGDGSYAEPSHDAHEAYADQPPDGAAWSHERDPDDRYAEPPPPRQHAGPTLAFDDLPDHDEQRAPAFQAQSPRYEPPQHEPYPADDRSHQAAQEEHDSGAPEEEYEHDSRAPRRSGTILILAVLGLAVLGTAGALGYRAMFGGSMVSGLVPPLIKPDDKPIKVQPSQAQAGNPGQSQAGNQGAGERLVEHQEQPIDVQSANPPVPRVVNTIPVVSNAPVAPVPGAQPPANANPPAPPPQPIAAPPAIQTPPPAAANFPDVQAPQPAGSSGPAQSGAKPVHTVIIRPGQTANANANPAPGAAPPAAHAAKPHEQQAPREPRQTARGGGPLSIVPSPESGGRAREPERTHVATRTPAPPAEATPAGGGGYAVQVSSQRSEEEAQAAFSALQAKYPQELGGRHPMVRRADLGAKGVYYRALVGPFASGEQASELCSKLKAAGGSCIIQKN